MYQVLSLRAAIPVASHSALQQVFDRQSWNTSGSNIHEYSDREDVDRSYSRSLIEHNFQEWNMPPWILPTGLGLEKRSKFLAYWQQDESLESLHSAYAKQGIWTGEVYDWLKWDDFSFPLEEFVSKKAQKWQNLPKSKARPRPYQPEHRARSSRG